MFGGDDLVVGREENYCSLPQWEEWMEQGGSELVYRDRNQFEHLNQAGGYGREFVGMRDLMMMFWTFFVCDNQKSCCLAGVPMSLLVRSSYCLVAINFDSVTTYNHLTPVAQCRFVQFLVFCYPGTRSLYETVRALVALALELTP